MWGGWLAVAFDEEALGRNCFDCLGERCLSASGTVFHHGAEQVGRKFSFYGRVLAQTGFAQHSGEFLTFLELFLL